MLTQSLTRQVQRIHLSPPHMGETERALLLDAFDSNWIAPLGPHVEAFEAEFAKKAGVSHAAAVSSGTAALHLALQLVGVRAGDEVLVSTLTFAATANAIRYQGARPVFIDSDRASWNMDPRLLAGELHRLARSNERLPRAVIVVDIYGQCADYEPILAACAQYDIPVIEDAAEALGASYRGRSAGTLGHLGIFSFNGNKIITTSGGGMLVSENAGWIEQARFLATQARDKAPHYQHSQIGYNYRLSNLLAAVGRGQLQRLDARVARRRAIHRLYRELLGGLPGLEFMPEAAYGVCTRWLTCLTIDPEKFGATRTEVQAALEALNIESRPVWKPMHLQPVFAACRNVGGEVSASLFEYGLCLPSGSSLTDEQVALTAECVRRCHRQR